MPKVDPFRDDIFKSDIDFPWREFMFTLDQIAFLLDIEQDYLINNYLYLPGGRSTGSPTGRIRCTNIARPDQEPNWRVSETAFRFWCKQKGIKIRERTTAIGKAPRKR